MSEVLDLSFWGVVCGCFDGNGVLEIWFLEKMNVGVLCNFVWFVVYDWFRFFNLRFNDLLCLFILYFMDVVCLL